MNGFLKIDARPVECGLSKAIILVALTMTCACLLLPVGAVRAWADSDAISPESTVGSAFATITAAANVESSSTITLSPGQTYDVSTAMLPTEVKIASAGDYHLKGTSGLVHVSVVADGANLYLEDGLDMQISNKKTVAESVIDIGEQGGTVKIISAVGADVKLMGFDANPAIGKNGTTTKLVFDTADANHPGTITATAGTYIMNSSKLGAPAIGGGVNSKLCGNIVFQGGNIIAYGKGGPGIGSPSGSSVDGITVTGGNVQSYGGSSSAIRGPAGIGTAGKGTASNITITGGTVFAQAGEITDGKAAGGAGIGSGTNGFATNITITGGTVKAYGAGTSVGGEDYGGAGIGAGYAGKAARIVISGGIVIAVGGTSGYAAGIGEGSTGSCADVTIKGGFVSATASRGGYGIGAAKITITGGTTNATGDASSASGGASSAAAGGGIGSQVDKAAVAISGGRITAKSSAVSIPAISGAVVSVSGGTTDTYNGTDEGTVKADSFYVTGGSLKASSSSSTAYRSSGGIEVKRTQITLEGVTDDSANVTAATLQEASAYSYGLQDVNSLGGRLYFWLPTNVTAYEVKALFGSAPDAQEFDGKIAGATEGELYLPDSIVLQSGDASRSNGSATVRYYTLKLSDLVAPQMAAGQKITGYALESSAGTRIADANGILVANVEGYTDGTGHWIYTGTTPLNLYPIVDSTTYQVRFDANQPASASHDVTGTMADQAMTYGQQTTLETNDYALIGWTFSGWNSKADGSGTAYTGGASVENLGSGTVVLYAQWKARTYSIAYDAGGGTSTMDAQTDITYDSSVELSANGFKMTGAVFAGWRRQGSLGSHYADRATVKNLCTIGTDGALTGATLIATWLPTSAKVTVLVRKDGVDWSEVTDVTLEPATGQSVALTYSSTAGVWTATDAPDGIYQIKLKTASGWFESGQWITVGTGNASAVLDYVTASVTQDSGLTGACIGKAGQTSTLVLAGTSVPIDVAGAFTGYAFSAWTFDGSRPGNWLAADNPTVKKQDVTISGTVTFTAQSQPAAYQVVFNKNADDATGTMTDEAMVYGTAKDLTAAAFARTGYDFDGWNTKADGSGTGYADGASVENLAAADGAKVDLYAQWKAHTYSVAFDDNGGMGLMEDQAFSYGTSQALSKNMFKRDSHDFIGWNTKDDGTGTAYTDGGNVENLTAVDGNRVTLYAQWRQQVYTVNYNANGGTGTMAPETLDCGVTEPLTACTFERTGFTFAAWNTAPNGTGASYADLAQVTDLEESGNAITLYAQWVQSAYSIAFDANGGTGTMDAQSMVFGTAVPLPANEFTRSGYSFAGWNTEDDGTGTAYADGARVLNLTDEPDATVTLYAQWTQDSVPADDPGTTPSSNGSSSSGSSSRFASSMLNTGDIALPTVLAILLISASTALTARRKRRQALR